MNGVARCGEERRSRLADVCNQLGDPSGAPEEKVFRGPSLFASHRTDLSLLSGPQGILALWHAGETHTPTKPLPISKERLIVAHFVIVAHFAAAQPIDSEARL